MEYNVYFPTIVCSSSWRSEFCRQMYAAFLFDRNQLWFGDNFRPLLCCCHMPGGEFIIWYLRMFDIGLWLCYHDDLSWALVWHILHCSGGYFPGSSLLASKWGFLKKYINIISINKLVNALCQVQCIKHCAWEQQMAKAHRKRGERENGFANEKYGNCILDSKTKG